MVSLRQYVGLNGTSPFGQWLDGLDDPAAARVLTTLTRIEQGITRWGMTVPAVDDLGNAD